MNSVLVSSNNPQCGIADYSRFLRKALEDAGLKITFISLDQCKTTVDFINLAKRLKSVDLVHIQHEWAFFHKNLLWSALNSWLFMHQIKAPLVVTMHELMPSAKGGLFYKLACRLLYYAQRFVFSQADILITHSAQAASFFEGAGINKERIRVMVHPVPEEQIMPLDNDSAQQILEAGDTREVITIFGFVTARKHYSLVLEAIKDLNNCVLLIAGGPHPNDKTGYFECLKNEINRLGLASKVKLYGYVPQAEISHIMSLSKILLVPINDSLGSGSFSFAVAYAKPVIAMDTDYFKNLKEQGFGIELFGYRDGRDLSKKITALLNNPQRREELSILMRRAAQQYSYSKTAQATCQIYRNAVGGRTAE